jgi:hypothetical protein
MSVHALEEFEDTKGQLESVHQRRTDNTTHKQRSTKHYAENKRLNNTKPH